MRHSKIDQAAQEIHRTWGDVDVVDADEDLRVMILPEDVKSATQQDPGCCVFAQACRRSFGATKVLFFRTVAYVELPKHDGSRRVERFFMTLPMRKLIEAFDRGEHVIPKAGFILRAPPPSETFERRRLQNKRTDERRKLRGYSEAIGNQGKGKYTDKMITIDLLVRSGVGAVSFQHKKKMIRYANDELKANLAKQKRRPPPPPPEPAQTAVQPANTSSGAQT